MVVAFRDKPGIKWIPYWGNMRYKAIKRGIAVSLVKPLYDKINILLWSTLDNQVRYGELKAVHLSMNLHIYLYQHKKNNSWKFKNIYKVIQHLPLTFF